MNPVEQFASIEEYSAYLIKHNSDITSDTFLNECNREFIRIDEQILFELYEWLANEDEFCIDANDAFPRYKIATLRSAKDTLKFLMGLELVEGKDFRGRNENLEGEPMPLVYVLTPRAFKVCLANSRSGRTFMCHYNAVDQCFIYFDRIKNLRTIENVGIEKTTLSEESERWKEESEHWKKESKRLMEENADQIQRMTHENDELRKEIHTLTTNNTSARGGLDRIRQIVDGIIQRE